MPFSLLMITAPISFVLFRAFCPASEFIADLFRTGINRPLGAV